MEGKLYQKNRLDLIYGEQNNHDNYIDKYRVSV